MISEEIVWWYCFIDEPRVEKIQELEDQQLKHDLNFLEGCHEQLSQVEEMSWEELQFIGEKNANICLYDACDGCGHCVDICPSDIMHIDPVTRR